MAMPLHPLLVVLSLSSLLRKDEKPFSSSIKDEATVPIPFHPMLQIFMPINTSCSVLGMVVDCGRQFHSIA